MKVNSRIKRRVNLPLRPMKRMRLALMDSKLLRVVKLLKLLRKLPIVLSRKPALR